MVIKRTDKLVNNIWYYLTAAEHKLVVKSADSMISIYTPWQHESSVLAKFRTKMVHGFVNIFKSNSNINVPLNFRILN